MVPSEAEVQQRIDDLGQTLLLAAESDSPEDLADLRRIVEMLTGGRILVTQQGEPKPQRGWPRLTFRSRLVAYLLGRFNVQHPKDDDVEVSIDVRKRPKRERIAEAVKKRADEGVLLKTVAKEFKAGKPTITAALQ